VREPYEGGDGYPEAGEVVSKYLSRRSILSEASLMENQEATALGKKFLEPVLHDDHGKAVPIKGAKDRTECLVRLGVEVGKGFIEKEHLWPKGQD